MDVTEQNDHFSDRDVVKNNTFLLSLSLPHPSFVADGVLEDTSSNLETNTNLKVYRRVICLGPRKHLWQHSS